MDEELIRHFMFGFQIFLEKQVAELSQSGIKRFVYRPSEFLQGGFRTSSKVSIHNHEDPEECPFAIDDGKAGDYRSRYSGLIKWLHTD